MDSVVELAALLHASELATELEHANVLAELLCNEAYLRGVLCRRFPYVNDDMVQDLREQMIHAARLWKPQTTMTFRRWLIFKGLLRMIDKYRRDTRYRQKGAEAIRKPLRLDDPVNEDKGDKTYEIAQDDPGFVQVDDDSVTSTINLVFSKIRARDQMIIRRYCNNETMLSIGESVGLTESRCSQIITAFCISARRVVAA